MAGMLPGIQYPVIIAVEVLAFDAVQCTLYRVFFVKR